MSYTSKITDHWVSLQKRLLASPEYRKTRDYKYDKIHTPHKTFSNKLLPIKMSALQIKELIKMQTIMADSIKTQNLYIQKQIDAEKASKKIMEDFTANKDEFLDNLNNEQSDFYTFKSN